LIDSLHFGVCVCDATIAPRIGSTAVNKLRWRNCPDKIHYKSHCDWEILR